MDKIDRYKEIDFDVMEAIKNSPSRGLFFSDLTRLGIEQTRLKKSLRKLCIRNFLANQLNPEGNYFFITEINQPMNIKRVVCPICKTITRTHRDDQKIIHCSNPECKTPKGKQRVFWLVNMDNFRKGVVKRLNQVC